MPRRRKTISLKTRLYVIKRDKSTCQYCGKRGTLIFRFAKPTVVENPKKLPLESYEFYNGKDVIPFEIDHILAVHDGGTDSVDNLALSCRKCNRRKEVRTRYGIRKNAKTED